MKSPDLIQLIISYCIALGSIGLLVITLIYAIATRRMADEMKRQSSMFQREFELRIAPRIEPKIHMKTSDVMDPVLEISVINKGFYVVKFDYVYYRWWHRINPNDAKTDIYFINKWLDNGDQETFEIKFDFSKIAKFRNASDVKGNGMAEVELHFTDVERKPFTELKGKVIMY